MLPEEGRCTAIGKIGIGLVVVRAADAREGVVHFRIDMDSDKRIAAQAVAEEVAQAGHGPAQPAVGLRGDEPHDERGRVRRRRVQVDPLDVADVAIAVDEVGAPEVLGQAGRINPSQSS